MLVAASGYARHYELGVIRLAHAGQLFEKCDDRPKLLVAVVAPGRHAGHLDAVLEDPEKLGGAAEQNGFCQIRWRGIEAPRDVALRYAWCAVAGGAMRRKMLDADKHVCRIIQPQRRGDAGRMHFDRVEASRISCVVKSAENEAVMTGRWVTTPASK